MPKFDYEIEICILVFGVPISCLKHQNWCLVLYEIDPRAQFMENENVVCPTILREKGAKSLANNDAIYYGKR